MLTDLFLDKQDCVIHIPFLCGALSEVCVPFAGRCIGRLQNHARSMPRTDELMIEFELCVGLIFKPFRHHLKSVLSSEIETCLTPLWKSILAVMDELLRPRPRDPEEVEVPGNIVATMNDLATEHFHSSIQLLIAASALHGEPKKSGDLSSQTWDTVRRIGISEESTNEWKKGGKQKEES
jgi:hypothetical protein